MHVCCWYCVLHMPNCCLKHNQVCFNTLLLMTSWFSELAANAIYVHTYVCIDCLEIVCDGMSQCKTSTSWLYRIAVFNQCH